MVVESMKDESNVKTGESKQGYRKFKKLTDPKKEWKPQTDLGHLVKAGKITIDEIFRYGYKIHEPEIVDHLLEDQLKEARISVKSVQKQTRAGQKTRLKACVVVGDGVNHIGLGCKSAADIATATRAAIKRAKCNIRQIKLGYWGNAVGEPHTVKAKASGKCGSVRVTVYPGRKGTDLVTAPKIKQIFKLAGIKDVNTRTTGSTKTTENFAKAAIKAIENASNVYDPEMWEQQPNELSPFMVHSKFLDRVRK